MARKPAPLTGEKARDYSGIAEKATGIWPQPASGVYVARQKV
jgi:hypothetical protein